MIVVRVELHSAIDGSIRELARMDICNEGGSQQSGDYGVYVMRGRDRKTLACRNVQRHAKVLGHARLREHVWNLVAKGLVAAGYGRTA